MHGERIQTLRQKKPDPLVGDETVQAHPRFHADRERPTRATRGDQLRRPVRLGDER